MTLVTKSHDPLIKEWDGEREDFVFKAPLFLLKYLRVRVPIQTAVATLFRPQQAQSNPIQHAMNSP